MAIGWKSTSLFSGVDKDKVKIAYDHKQFLFVDGRENGNTRRIMINGEHEVVPSYIGLQGSYKFPEVWKISFSDDNDKGTGIGKGSIFGYVAVEVNQFEEMSKPSPLTIIDTLQFQRRGEINSAGEYIYDYSLSGSIESITIRHYIASTETKRVMLYRVDAYASESSLPMGVAKLVKTVTVQENAAYVDIVDSYPYSPSEVNYDTNIASPADDITLTGGTAFLANAVSSLAYPAEITNIFALTISNPNNRNYVNGWLQVDLRDSNVGNGVYLDGYDWDTYDSGKVRIMDTDMVTPLRVYAYPVDQVLKDGEGNNIDTRRYAFIRIPYLPTGASKVIYFVVSEDLPLDYPNAIIEIADDVDVFLNEIVCNPVRGINTVICNSSKELVYEDWLPSDYKTRNKANELYDASEKPTFDSTEIVVYDEYGNTVDGVSSVPDTKYNALASLIRHYTSSSIFLKRKGFFYGWFLISSTASGEQSLVALNEDSSDFVLLLTFEHDAILPQLNITLTATKNGSPDSVATAQISALSVSGESSLNRVFILCSWENIIAPDNDDSTINLYLAVMDLMSGTRTYRITDVESIGTVTDPAIIISGDKNLAISIADSVDKSSSHFYLEYDEYINAMKHVKQFARFMPYYPTEFIGCGDTTTGDYYDNKNIEINEIFNINDTTAGRIVWNKYQNMSALNEKNTNEEIVRIKPFKSTKPTDEHNTILIWTASRKLMVLTLLGDNGENCNLHTENHNMGLVNSDALVDTDNGLAWIDIDFVYHLTENGLERISYKRVPTDSIDKLTYDQKHKWLWLWKGINLCYIYDFVNKLWIEYQQAEEDEGQPTPTGIEPFMFFEHKYPYNNSTSDYCMLNINAMEDGKIYHEADDTLHTMIKTKYFNIGRKNYIRRITVNGTNFDIQNSYQYLANLISVLIGQGGDTAGYTSTAEYTAYYNKKHSIPNVKADFIQYELINVDGVTNIDLEVQ